MSNKQNEYGIRKAVVARLLDEGWAREDIRLEIPLSTNSSGGRIDILCLGADYIGGIELKSEADKLCPDSLGDQVYKYKRAFDYCAVIADYRHRKVTTTTGYRSQGRKDNFRNIEVAWFQGDWNRESGFIQVPYDFEFAREKEKFVYLDKITPHLFPARRKTRLTSVYDMACVLWKDELNSVLGKGTKNSLELVARNKYGVDEFRKMMAQCLKARPLNSWEEKFWEQYDSEVKA